MTSRLRWLLRRKALATAVLLAGVTITTGCASSGAKEPSADKPAAPAAVTTPEAAAQPAPKPKSPTELVIHYHRYDGEYTGAGLWTWNPDSAKTPQNPEVLATGTSDFGVYFRIDTSLYGEPSDPKRRIGYIARLRRDWNFKDGTDRFWTPAQGQEIWLVGNDPKVYTQRPDISPKIQFANIDALDRITVTFTHPMPATEAVPGAFAVHANDGGKLKVRTATPLSPDATGRARSVELTLAEQMNLAASYKVQATGYQAAVAKPRRIMDNFEVFGTDKPLGAIWEPTATTFRTFSPLAEEVEVVLYDDRLASKGRTVVPMKNAGRGVWEARVEGNLEGRYYRLEVKTARYGEHEIIDPMATNTVGDDRPARITNLRAEDPDSFRPIKRVEYGANATDAVIYQLHVRDFTINPNSGVSEKNRGRFLGFTETGTTLPGRRDITTGIDHLKELGVTHIYLQPIQDFDNDEEQDVYNWGYMTSFFESPDGWFSSDHTGTAKIRETKAMVKALKDAGFNVIIDGVYNHTGTQATFELLAPGYYLRQREDGSFWNGSGTGNEFRSEAPMARRFIINSVRFWMEEYGIDGFRLDLMGLIDIETLKQLRAEMLKSNPQMLLFGEPWAAGDAGIKQIVYKDVVRGTGIGAFNDHFRDAIKGSTNGNDPGYVQTGTRRDGVMKGIEGAINDWSANPIESINYCAKHDNLDLWDKLEFSMPKESDAERRKMQKLAGGILAVSQGVMQLHGGQDFARYKQGNNNSYNAGDAVNGIDWSRKVAYNDVFQFYKGAIAIRRSHPVFRMAKAEDVRARLKWHNDGLPVPDAIVFSLNGAGLAGESWKDVVVLINPNAKDQTFTLPMEGAFDAFIHDHSASTTALASGITGKVTVSGRSMTLLAR